MSDYLIVLPLPPSAAAVRKPLMQTHSRKYNKCDTMFPMPQKHPQQHGTFHVTTSTQGRAVTLTASGIPERLIHHLCDTRGMQGAKLYAFCILPDHIHILLCPGEKGLSAFMHAFKKNSSRELSSLTWQKGFHDERIRDDKQRGTAIGYIQGNAMKHQLVTDIVDWPWTSLHFQDVLDPMEIWL